MAKMFSSLRLGTLRSRKARPGSVAAATTSPNTTMTNCNNTTMTSITTTSSPCGDSSMAQDNALLQQQQQYMSSGYFMPSFLSLDELSESAAVGCSASPTSVTSKVAQV